MKFVKVYTKGLDLDNNSTTCVHCLFGFDKLDIELMNESFVSRLKESAIADGISKEEVERALNYRLSMPIEQEDDFNKECVDFFKDYLDNSNNPFK